MARKKPSDPILQYATEYFRPSYYRTAGRFLYGEHDVEKLIPVLGQDANGNLVATGWEVDIVPDPRLVRWIDALMAFDDREHHDKAPLAAMLDSDVEVLPIVGIWLANLVWRHNILTDGIEDYVAQRRQLACLLREFVLPPTKPGPPMVAAYDMSDRDEELSVDNEKVTNHLETHGGTVDDAVAAIASKKYPHAPEAQARYAVTLRNFREGRNTSHRRMAKRRA
jgi:hypothetical protein